MTVVHFYNVQLQEEESCKLTSFLITFFVNRNFHVATKALKICDHSLLPQADDSQGNIVFFMPIISDLKKELLKWRI